MGNRKRCIGKILLSLACTGHAYASPGCAKWTVLQDATHPAWPAHYVRDPISCSVPTVSAAPAHAIHTHAGARIVLRFGMENGSVAVQATALQEGSVGEVIRFRSLLNDAVLRGRLDADGGATLVIYAVKRVEPPVAGAKEGRDE